MTTGIFEDQAWILHRQAWQEDSLLVCLFTERHGLQRCVARQARKSRKQRQALLQPFRPLSVRWRSSGTLAILQEVEGTGRPLVLEGRTLFCGLYINELLYRLVYEGEAELGLYGGYVTTLEALVASDRGLHPALVRTFERNVLICLGHWPDFARAIPPIEPDSLYHWLPGHGLAPVGPTSTDGIPGRLLLEMADTRRWVELAGCKGVRTLTRGMINALLGDRPLVSRALFQPVKEN
jgi:DNA repair protein RecO (recombination protein O)